MIEFNAWWKCLQETEYYNQTMQKMRTTKRIYFLKKYIININVIIIFKN